MTPAQPLVMMILDVTEETHGRFNIWGKTLDDEIVLLHVNDFLPYFYIGAPTDQVTRFGIMWSITSDSDLPGVNSMKALDTAHFMLFCCFPYVHLHSILRAWYVLL